MKKELNNIEEAKHFIAQAAEDAIRTIATAANEATRVVATATATATKLAEFKNSADHDLLVKLDTKMEALKYDIQDLKDGTSKRISTLETEKVNTRDSYPVLYKADVEKQLTDHEARLRAVSTRVVVMGTVGSAILFVIGLVEFLISQFLNLVK